MGTQTNASTMPTPKVHHRWRTFFASFLGSIALMLIFVSILTVWFTRTITNTKTYVSTVAPLASDPDVQTFVAQKASEEITNNLPIQDAANKLLPGQDTTQATETLRDLVRPIVEKNVAQVVTSQQFADIWKSTNQNVHAQLISQLNSSAVQNELTLDLTPVINGVTTQLKATQLGDLIGQNSIDPKAGTITIKNDNVSKLRSYYKQLKRDTILCVMVALVFATLAIIVSVHHAKTFRRVLFGTGFITLLLAFSLQMVSKLHFSGMDAAEQKAVLAMERILLHNLIVACLVIGISCMVVAIMYKLFEVYIARRNTPAKTSLNPNPHETIVSAPSASTDAKTIEPQSIPQKNDKNSQGSGGV